MICIIKLFLVNDLFAKVVFVSLDIILAANPNKHIKLNEHIPNWSDQ